MVAVPAPLHPFPNQGSMPLPGLVPAWPYSVLCPSPAPSKRALSSITPASSHLSKTKMYLQQAEHEWGSVASPPAVVTGEAVRNPSSQALPVSRHQTAPLPPQPTTTTKLPSPLQPRGKEERAVICQEWQNQGPRRRQTQLNDAELFSSKELQGRSPNPTPIHQLIYPIAYLLLPAGPACLSSAPLTWGARVAQERPCPLHAPFSYHPGGGQGPSRLASRKGSK